MEWLSMANEVNVEAFKSFGVFTFVFLVLTVALYLSERRCRAAVVENGKLRLEIAALNTARLDDAKEMIRVTNTATATMLARADGDADFRQQFSRLVAMLSSLSDRLQWLSKSPPLIEGSK